ncbi:MAG: phytanoyl-CoA dioxygenase family protein [Spirochaetaceae bacterium]|nr:phytanoyl-CoA dioxygenase family protein [Spirochaetaceae bacterium]
MEQQKLRALSPESVADFRINGFLKVEHVLTDHQVATLGDHADLIADGRASHIPDSSLQLEPVFRDGATAVADRVLATRKLFNMAVYDDLLWRHATNPAVVDIVADLLGTDDIKMYGDQLFMKSPVTGSAQPWHQDSASWRDIYPMDLVTAWTAIDDATLNNGCLRFVPGTHRWGMLSKERLDHFIDDLETERWPAVPVPVPAGSISFHHSLTLHTSSKNTSPSRRRAYAIHYMRASSWQDVAVTDAPKMPPFKQVRGCSFPGRV